MPSDQKCNLQVHGMTCANCSATVESGLLQLPGVQSVTVSLLLHKAQVVFDSTITSNVQLSEEVEDLGFGCRIINVSNSRTFELRTDSTMDPQSKSSVRSIILSENGVISADIIGCDIFVEFDPNFTGIRTVSRLLESKGINTSIVSNPADFKSKANEINDSRDSENMKWSNLLFRSVSFTLPIIFITMICPHVPVLKTIVDFRIFAYCKLGTFLSFLLCTPVQFWIGAMFYKGAYHSLRRGGANMDVLIAVGTSTTYLSSLISIISVYFQGNVGGITGNDRVYFETSAMLITIVILGKYLESLAKGRTSAALSKLLEMSAHEALLVVLDENNKVVEEELIECCLVQVNDIVKVGRAEKIPVDGIIVKGQSTVDESLITGESIPVAKE
eukprot:68651_1